MYTFFESSSCDTLSSSKLVMDLCYNKNLRTGISCFFSMEVATYAAAETVLLMATQAYLQ